MVISEQCLFESRGGGSALQLKTFLKTIFAVNGVLRFRLLFTRGNINCSARTPSLSPYCISSHFISYSRSIFTQQPLGLRITSYSPAPAVLSQRLHSNLRNVHIMFILLPGKQRERERERERERLRKGFSQVLLESQIPVLCWFFVLK